ncbi:MAG: hypothetical protein Q9159_000978 [Coniocarpon cinnabarinum]
MDWETRITNAQNALAKLPAVGGTELPRKDSEAFARTFDHTLLKPEAVPEQVRTLCEEAVQNKFATVCVREPFAQVAQPVVKDTGVQICCVVGFHDPTTSTLEQKLAEARSAVRGGATELDLVMNWPCLKNKQYDTVYEELRAMRGAFPKDVARLKVILETSQLCRDEIVAACVLASQADFDFVKTSTGFVGSGAKVEDVQLMHQMCQVGGKGMAVKASGGIRTLQDAMAMLEAGADRLGASASVSIINEA